MGDQNTAILSMPDWQTHWLYTGSRVVRKYYSPLTMLVFLAAIATAPWQNTSSGR